jgi:hypothetical protein
MADLKKQVDDVATGIKEYDPLKDVRADVESIGKNLDESIKGPDKPADQSAAEVADRAVPAPTAEAFPIPEAAAELRDKEVAGAGVGPVAPDAAAESTSSSGSGRAP